MLMFAKSRVSGAKERTATQSETGCVCGGQEIKEWMVEAVSMDSSSALSLQKNHLPPLLYTRLSSQDLDPFAVVTEYSVTLSTLRAAIPPIS